VDSVKRQIQEEWLPQDRLKGHALEHTAMYQEIIEGFLTVRETKLITEQLFTHENTILNIDQDYFNGDAYEGLTRQHRVYNWLSNDVISRIGLPNKLFQLPLFKDWEDLYIQCWGNILRQGQNLPQHCHRGVESEAQDDNRMYAMNIFLSGHTTTGTIIEGTKHHNDIGELVILGEDVEHKVRTNYSQTPRVSLAMDVYDRDFTKGDSRMREDERRYKHFKNPFMFKPIDSRS